MRQRLGFHRFLIRVLCFLLVFQGDPLTALEGSGRLELSEPAWAWLDEQIEGSLSALESTPPDLEVPEVAVFWSGSGGTPPVPPGFRAPEELSPSLRDFYGEVGLKSALDAVSLVPGWNLASIPEEPVDPDPAQVLAPIAGAFSVVWAYDACDAADPWKLYDPGDPTASDLTAIDHKIGFWIDATAPVDLPSDGTLPASTTFQLCTGWNLIGFPAGQPRHVRNALQSIEGKYVRVFGYDPTDVGDPWEIFDVAVPEWANDLELMQPGRGYWVLVTQATTLEIANEAGPPEVRIHAPEETDVITDFTDVVGTVRSRILDHWELSYRLLGESAWTPFAQGLFPAETEALATFDPTLLRNALYELRLQATDIEGRQASTTVTISVEGGQKIGHVKLDFVDLEIQVSSLPIQIIRTYDSRDTRRGDFGAGWRLSVTDVSLGENVEAGNAWQGTVSPGAFPAFCVVSTLPHIVAVVLPTGQRFRNAPSLVPSSGLSEVLDPA